MSNNPTIIDLFAGCGGFSLGAHQAGYETAHAVDIDPILSSSFKENFHNTKHHIADVSDIDMTWVKTNIATTPDGIVGGPPCQGFSFMGRNLEVDSRRDLVREFFRVVNLIGPKFFVFENVLGILSDRHKHVLKSGISTLGNNWNVSAPFVMDASNFGAPTKRKRVFVVGVNSDYGSLPSDSHLFNPLVKDIVTVEDAISDLRNARKARIGEDGRTWTPHRKLQRISNYANSMRGSTQEVSGHIFTNHTDTTIKRFKLLKPGKTDSVGRYPRLQWKGLCPTLRAGTGSDKGSYQAVRPIHPSEHRVITPRECARLQGFPDWFLFHPTTWHSCRMIGNSVSPVVAKILLQRIADNLSIAPNVKFPPI